jgi:hypothetical protein
MSVVGIKPLMHDPHLDTNRVEPGYKLVDADPQP